MAINFPEGTQDLPSRVIQVVNDYSDTHYTALTDATWHTVGNLSVSITPVSGSSKILLLGQVGWWLENGNEVAVRARRTVGGTDTTVRVGSGTNLQGTTMDHTPGGSGWQVNTSHIMVLDTPATTSQITYTLQIQPQGGRIWINRSYNTSGTDSIAGLSTLTAMEIIDP